jgi:hypothetical protein
MDDEVKGKVKGKYRGTCNDRRMKPGKVKSGKLNYIPDEKRLETTLSFDDSPIEVNDKFLAILIPVDEVKTSEPPIHQFGVNHPVPEPEVANF